MDYAAKEKDADFLMNQVFNVQQNWSQIEAYQEFSEELVRAVVAEGGRLATTVMASPTSWSGAITVVANRPPSAPTARPRSSDNS